jgi:hypothetical protein
MGARPTIHRRNPARVIHSHHQHLTTCQDSQTEELLSTTTYYSIADSLIGSPLADCG